jgi:hypothetical protein
MSSIQYEVAKEPLKSTRFVVTSFEDAGPAWLLKLEHLKSLDKFKDVQKNDVLISEFAAKSKDKEQALLVTDVAEKIVVTGFSKLTEGLNPIKEGDILFTIARAHASK